jgi:hypothetical protein
MTFTVKSQSLLVHSPGMHHLYSTVSLHPSLAQIHSCPLPSSDLEIEPLITAPQDRILKMQGMRILCV